MIIAQITDFHVTAPGALCYGRVPTNAQLASPCATAPCARCWSASLGATTS
jgi:hypothetical protein